MPQAADDWDDVVEGLYAHATHGETARRLPASIGRLVSGTSAALYTLRPGQGGLAGPLLCNLPGEAMALYATHYQTHDPWVAQLHRMTPGRIIDGASLIENAALSRSLYYNEFGRRFGTFHVIGAMLPLGPAADDAIGMIAVHRPKRAAPFSQEEKDRIGRLLPHVRRGLHLQAQIGSLAEQAAEAAMGAFLEALPVAAAVADRQGRVLHANALAERIDAAGVGLSLRLRSERAIGARLPVDTKKLHAAIALAALGGPGGVLRLQLRSKTLLATVSPLPVRMASTIIDPRQHALVLLRSLEIDATDQLVRRCSQLFGLTRAEAETANALSCGMAPLDIATMRAVRISTVRTLLKRAQDKTGSSNLRDLVRILTLVQA